MPLDGDRQGVYNPAQQTQFNLRQLGTGEVRPSVVSLEQEPASFYRREGEEGGSYEPPSSWGCQAAVG